jgi:hypothetical protein
MVGERGVRAGREMGEKRRKSDLKIGHVRVQNACDRIVRKCVRSHSC